MESSGTETATLLGVDEDGLSELPDWDVEHEDDETNSERQLAYLRGSLSATTWDMSRSAPARARSETQKGIPDNTAPLIMVVWSERSCVMRRAMGGLRLGVLRMGASRGELFG